MSNLVAFPVLLPLAAGIILLMFHGRVGWQRRISFLASAIALVVSGLLVKQVWFHGVQAVQAGGWAAPFGITLAADLLAGMMVSLAAITQFTALIFAFRDLDPGREQAFFHPMVQFLMIGINLSFVTGDLFNLFVAFEVMLIASYYLLAIGGAAGQLREGFKYLVINAGASTLFLLAVVLLYGITRTLNMADLAQKVATLPGNPLITLIGIAFLIVFGIKAAVFPFYFWLPRSYFQAPSAVAAMFAAMLTKVGVYCLIRVFTLIFIHDVTYTHTIILVLAGLTMFLGVVGAIGQMDFKAILSYHIISQVGYMIMGLGLFSRLALAGAVFYVAHHIIIKSALFLVARIAERITGTTDLRRFSGLLRTHPGLAFVFFAAGISLAGIPIFSGFFAKFALLRAAIAQSSWTIAAVSLLVSLLTLYSMVKIYRKGFWGPTTGPRHSDPPAAYAQLVLPVVILLGLSTVMGLGAGRMMEFALATSDQLLHPEAYIQAVLGG